TNRRDIGGGREKSQTYQITHNCLHVAIVEMKKRIDHLLLQLVRDAPDHAEIKHRQLPIRHHQEIPRMRVGMKETVFEQLLEVSAIDQFVNASRAVTGCA